MSMIGKAIKLEQSQLPQTNRKQNTKNGVKTVPSKRVEMLKID